MSYDGEVRIKTKVDTSQMQRLDIQIEKTTNKIASLSAKYEELKNKKIPTDDYKEVQKQIDITQARLDKLLAKKESFKGSHKSTSWLNMNAEIDELQASLPYLKGELQELVDTGKAFTLGKDTDEFKKLSSDLSTAQAELRSLNTKKAELITKSGKVSDGLRKIGQVGKKAFAGMNQGVKKSSGLMGAFANRLKGIALSLLIFNWISKAFNAVVAGIKEGFQNLVKYSDDYNQSVSKLKSANTQMKNSFATAVAPLVQMVIPYLIEFIRYLTNAANKVAQLTAALTGKTTWTKAKEVQQDYAKSLDKTADAAKKAVGQLAGFDKLDVLRQDSEDKNSEKPDEILPEDMFEEVPIDKEVISWLENIKEKLQPIIDYVKMLKDLLVEGFFDGLGDWEPRMQNIRDNLKLIKDTLIDIFTDSNVMAAADKYMQSLAYNMGRVVGAFASIGLTIAQNLIGGIEKYLSQNSQRIKDYLVSMFNIGTEINDLMGDYAEAVAYIFEAFGSENGQQMTANLIGIFADTFMRVGELCLKFGRDIIKMITAPIVENKELLRQAFEDGLGVISDILGTIKEALDKTFDKIHEIYDNHFKPFFDSIADGLSVLLEKFLTFWQENVLPILECLAKKFDEIILQHVQPALSKFAVLLGNLIDVLKLLWEKVLVPFISWFIENVLPAASHFIEVYGKAFLDVVSIVADAISNVLDILNGLLDFILGIFTGDFDRAMQGIGGIFTGLGGIITNIANALLSVWEFMISNFVAGFRLLGEPVSSLGGVFENIYNFYLKIANKILDVIDILINGTIDGINKMATALNNIRFDIPDWVPGIGGKHFGLDIKKINNIDVPRLAEGAVIRGGNPFMAILGDQQAGHTNIEAPADLIKQMVREGIRETGMQQTGKQTINMSLKFEGSLSELGRVLKPVIDTENNRLGISMITNVGSV